MSLSTAYINSDEQTGVAASTVAKSRSVSELPIELVRVSGAAWDEVAVTFEGVCQEQLFVFATNRWPGVELEPVVFKIDGEIIGGVLMMIQPLPLKLGSIAVSKWGPIFKDNKRADQSVVYARVIDALIAEYDIKRRMMISVLPRAHWGEGNPEFETLSARGFSDGSVLPFPDRYVVNLRLDDEAQRKSFAQKWRYHLNKANKAGLEFEHGSADRIDDFDALYQAMNARKKFADHSAYDDTIHALMQIADPKLRPEVFFVREGGEIIAGAVIFKAGDTAVYLYGATEDRALPLRAGYFLHWHIIRWLRDNTEASWYDLGGTDGFQGLHQFKKGMVGEAGVIAPVPPVANYASDFRARLAGTIAFAARDGLARIRQIIEFSKPGAARPDQKR